MEHLGVMGCLYLSNDDWGVGSIRWLRATWTWNFLVILFWMFLLYPLLLFLMEASRVEVSSLMTMFVECIQFLPQSYIVK